MPNSQFVAHYSNTKPRISSPLTCELTFDSSHHHHQLELKPIPTTSPTTFSSSTTPIITNINPKSLLALFLLDGLVCIQFITYLSLSLDPEHLNYLLRFIFNPAPMLLAFDQDQSSQHREHTFQFITNISTNLIILLTIAFIKSLSGTCLVLTGTSPTSYLIKNSAVFGSMIGLLSIPTHVPLSPMYSLTVSILTLLIFFVAGSIVISLPLLRLTQVLLDLEDQAPQNRSSVYNGKPTHPAHHSYQLRRASNLSRHPKLLQARYQHLMNPF